MHIHTHALKPTSYPFLILLLFALLSPPILALTNPSASPLPPSNILLQATNNPPTTTTRSPTTTTRSSTTTTTTTTLLPPAPPTPTLSRRCKNCPSNNTLGLICYKNTLCIPTSYLCNSFTNPCPDLPTSNTRGSQGDNNGGAGATAEVECRDQLCFHPTYLPLPSPGVGNILRSTRSSCYNGSYYSLYPSSSSASGNNSSIQQKYIQSCIILNQPLLFVPAAGSSPSSAPPPPPPIPPIACQKWEYLAQSSCLLRICGPDLSCEPPYTCHITNPTTDLYGICSTHPGNGDDGDEGSNGNTRSDSESPVGGHSKKERLLFNLLIALCSLGVVVALAIGGWHLRKRRLQRQGRYLAWTRKDRIHLLQAICCRRPWSQLWEDRRERLRVLQERQLKWCKPDTTSSSGSSGGSSYSLQTRGTGAFPNQQPASAPSAASSSSVTAAAPTIVLPSDSPISSRQEHTNDSNLNNDEDHRPISLSETESTESSLMNHQARHHRSVLDIFARRWQQQHQHLQQQLQQQQANEGRGIVVPESDPPPLYHQGPDLPSYRIPSTEIVSPPDGLSPTPVSSSRVDITTTTEPTVVSQQ